MDTHINFKKNEPGSFYPVLKTRVKAYLSTTGTPDHVSLVKCICLGSAYFITYIGLYVMSSPATLLLTYGALGIITTISILNVVHEAAHDALFTRKSLNTIVLLWMDFMGTNGQHFRRRHSHHHACSNIPSHDIDINNSPLVRVWPKSEYKSFHRFQKYYAVFFYLFYTLYWFFVRDILDITDRKNTLKLSLHQRVRVVLRKVLALMIFIALPALYSKLDAIHFIFGFILMHFTMSVLALITITSSHVNDETEFPMPDENGNLPYTWGEHQLRVTHDFGADNKLFTILMGGFNYHTAHHLFPSVCSRHLPAITKIIRETAKEYGLPYTNDNLWNGIKSHFRLIFNNSNPPEMDF